MKILFLHLTLGLVNRGSEISTDLIATALSKHHNVLVLQAGKVTKKPYTVKCVTPLKMAPYPSPRNLYEKILFRLGLNESARLVKEFTLASIPLITKFSPDIIIATNGAVQQRILHTHFPQSKIVVFGRAGIGHDDLANLHESPNLFVALSPQAEDWARKLALPLTKIVYIPNPLPLFKPKKINLNLPRPIVLTVGALSKYKNIDSVIKAVSSLQASLLLIGDGEESEVIADLLSHFPGEFRWLKNVDPLDIPTYYNSSDIFCFVPDLQEAFGRVYLEAMSAGLPIVASDDPIRKGIIGVNGNYVEPHNIDSVRTGIQNAHLQGRIDYSQDLMPYQIKTVVNKIEKEFHALIK